MAPQTARKALTTAQESRLVRYLDDEVYKLSGAFESRHSGTSRLPDLQTFLKALLPLHAFILAIPAAALRVAYLLNLTSFLAPALDGYTILDETVEQLFDVLARFDRGWVAVLRGDDWDSTTGRARSPAFDLSSEAGSSIPPNAYAGGLRTTDRARLESLIKQIRSVLAISLGLPQFVPLETDPFLEMLRHQQRPDLIPPIPGFRGARGAGGKSGSGSEYSATTGDEAMSQSDAMSVDTVTDGVTTPSAGTASESMSGLETDDGGQAESSLADMYDGNDDDDDDDADFEEVPVAGGNALSSSARAGFDPERLSNASVDPPEVDGSFEIHYEIPPPTLHDGEVTLENGATPIVGQRKGFDPDEDYPLSEEEGDPIVPPRRGADGDITEGDGEEEDGVDDSTRDRLKHVFDLTLQALEEIRVAEETGGQ